MRRTLLFCAAVAFAIACGDNITEPMPDRTPASTPQVAFATTTTDDGLSISTDKDDYQPGDVVHLTGYGWQPGDVLDIVLIDDPLTHDSHTWSVAVGEDGMFHDETYVVDEGDLNVSFTLVATSRATGRSLTVNFTDSQPTQVAVTPTPQSVIPGGSADYTVNVSMGGNSTNCTVTLSVSGLGAGITGAFSGGANPVTTNANFSRTLTLSTTAAVSASTVNFTVQAARGTTCQGNGTTDGTGTLNVLGPASKLAFGQQPTNALGGAAIAPAVTVEVQDAANHLLTSSSAPITLAIGSNPSGGTLSGTLTRTAVNGVATFTGISINKIGNGYTLAASSGTLTDATSNAFNITVGPASKLAFTTQPSGGTPGNAFADQPVVQVQDAGGNRIPSGQGSGAPVTLTIEPGTGTSGAALTCNTNPVTAVAGIASSTGCKINLAGNGYQLRASANLPTGSGPTVSTISSSFNIASADAQAPTINCTVPNQAIWYDDNVTVPCTASDVGSGLKNAGDASFSLVTSVANGSEDASAATDSRQVCDNEDNCATAGPYNFMVDRKAPTFSCGSADGAWHASDVAINCTAADGGSGLNPASDATFGLSTTVAANTETSNASTGSKVLTDNVGNTTTAGPISGNMIDKKAPAIVCGAADLNWHDADVSIHCTATDNGSGLADAGDASFNLTTSVAANSETANASTDSRLVKDKVDNGDTAGPITGNKVDKKDPVVNLTCPSAPVILNDPNATASWTAADGGSGVAGATSGTIALDASSAGQHTANAAAGFVKDNVNHSSAATSCNYNVAYNFSGLSAPVDRPNTMNVSKAGQGIPLKWRLTDAGGLPVLNFTGVGLNVAVSSLACSISLTLDQVEEYAGNSGLQNLGDGYYQFNWKTPAGYANSCRQIGLNLGEGFTRGPLAYFNFKK